MRSAPEMPIDATLIVCAGIEEVVGEPSHRRKFVTDLRIKIGVATASIDRPVANADIGEIGRTIDANGNVACPIDHPVVDAVVPANDGLRVKVSDICGSLADAVLPRNDERPRGQCQRAVYCGVVGAYNSHHAQGQLTAEYRRGERIARDDETNVDFRIQIFI